jgi:hypothetical protein
MCDCLEYEDGDMYLCECCAYIYKDDKEKLVSIRRQYEYLQELYLNLTIRMTDAELDEIRSRKVTADKGKPIEDVNKVLF